MNKKTLLIFLVIIILILAFLTQVFGYYAFGRTYVKNVDMKLTVLSERRLGFNADNDSLNFGSMIAGASQYKFIKLESAEKVFVKITLKGELSKWASVSENNFILQGDKELKFLISVPETAEQGNYTGKAIFEFKQL